MRGGGVGGRARGWAGVCGAWRGGGSVPRAARVGGCGRGGAVAASTHAHEAGCGASRRALAAWACMCPPTTPAAAQNGILPIHCAAQANAKEIFDKCLEVFPDQLKEKDGKKTEEFDKNEKDLENLAR